MVNIWNNVRFYYVVMYSWQIQFARHSHPHVILRSVCPAPPNKSLAPVVATFAPRVLRMTPSSSFAEVSNWKRWRTDFASHTQRGTNTILEREKSIHEFVPNTAAEYF